jgi:uncharacterized repeat protein (TIGR03806 family)
MRSLMKRFFAACLLSTLWACSTNSARSPDARKRVTDTGKPDAGKPDAGREDAGTADAGHATDAGIPDAGEGDAGAPGPRPRQHGIEARVENTTCFLNGTPPLAIVPVGSVAAFPSLSAVGAVGIGPMGGKLAVADSAGRVRAFAAASSGAKTSTVLDMSGNVRAGGLRGVAFRPDSRLLVASFVPTDDPLRLVVARFAVDVNGVAAPASQEVLLTLPLSDDTRAGGALAFLFDGTLAVALGDGGNAAAPTDSTSLAGKVVRIDVSADNGYAVPSDNPFATDATALHELYALGLGKPTSCSVDRVTGQLWCADAGDATRDYLLMVTKGATLRPILSFTRVGCGAVVGFVSRDASLPDIQGALVFGDACSAQLTALRFDGSLVRSQGNVVTLPAALAAFGEAVDGRLLAVDQAGAVHALVRPAGAAPTFPTSVSATGCIADMKTRAPAASLIPFEVRTPLWSDGAKKHRFIVLPGKQTIGFTGVGAWQFPVGTMFMKEFLLDADNDPKTADPIMETRFLVKRSETSWEGYSYMWDRARQDAFLLEGSEIGSYAMQPGAVDSSGTSVHRHTFPDRTQCLLCHNDAAGRALGLQTGRMNTDHDYGGFVENQLQAMSYAGLFSKPLPTPPDDLPRFPQPSDVSASLEDRARSWLYANCSHCHRPGGPTPVSLDFRFETNLVDTHACGVAPRFKISQLPNAKIIDPGSSANSELFFRLSRRDQNQMPPIASLIVDPVGVDALQKWTNSLTSCP